jgi:hypothetical protein
VIQNIKANLPPGSTHCDKAAADVGPQRKRPYFPPDRTRVDAAVVHKRDFDVDINTGAVGGPGALPRATSVSERSAEDACIVQVGSGYVVVGAGHCLDQRVF